MNDTIEVSVTVERKQADLPRYVVVPFSRIERWNLGGTTNVEVEIDGVPVSPRTIKRWDAERWFLNITAVDCRRLGIDTGSTIVLTLRRAAA